MVPLTQDIKEEPTTEYHEEDPIQDPIKHCHHHAGYSGSDRGRS